MAVIVKQDFFLSCCIEGFFYGLYSGIFAMYLQCPSRKSGTAIVVFYAVSLLYVLATVCFVTDLVALIIDARWVTESLQLQTDSQPMLHRLSIVRDVVSGFCDFLAQCILIYRCWIVWGKNIRVVIIPSFLAIAYLVIWLVTIDATSIVQDQNLIASWGETTILTALSASIAVNFLVTGFILFRILKVFLEVKGTMTLVERTLGSTGSTNSKLRHVLFVIIESAMALFAIQLIRLVFSILTIATGSESSDLLVVRALDYVIVIHQMLNGITPTIILVRASMRSSFDDEESFKEAAGSLCYNHPSDLTH